MTGPTRHSLVVLADVTDAADDAAAYFATLLDEIDQLGLQVVGVAVAPQPTALPVPDGWTATGAFAAAAGQVFAAASARRAHLLVVRATCRPTAAKLAELLRVLDDDPMIGCVHARFTTRDGRLLPAVGGDGRATVSPAVLSALPSFSFVADHVSACMLVPHRLTGNLEPRLDGWRSLDGLLLEYAVRVRRLGFHAVVANDALVALPDGTGGARAPQVADLRRIADAYPEIAAVTAAVPDQRDIVNERAIAALFDAPDSLLLDVRNLNAVINGTTKAIIGLTSAWYARRPALATTLWVPEAAARFHGLAGKYPGWEIVSEVPDGRHYAAAIRLSQPWHLSELLSLHAAAAVNTYLMLDTIAWDIAYTAPPGLDTVWQVAARTADCLIFISEFSRQRFLRRFPLGPGVRTAVVHLSLRPEDYHDPEREPASDGRAYWLVLGNAYDHKHVAPTVDTLARAFPTRELVVLGDRATPRGRRITQLPSGGTSEPLLQGLYAAATVVVFPSFYEGFGLPVVNALAYGRTVVARDTLLMRELAAAYAGPGRLVLFQDEVELVRKLTHLANDLPVESVAFAPRGTPAHGWMAAAAALEAELGALVGPPPTSTVREVRSFVAALLHDSRLSPEQ